MTKSEFNEAVQVAKSKEDLSHVDDSVLYGCGLPNFAPVRWQALQLNGEWDSNALNECREISRRKFIICN